MKRRDYKNIGINSIHHVYNRGNNKELIFLDNQDRRAFMFRVGLAIGIEKDTLNTSDVAAMPKSRAQIIPFSDSSFKIHAFCLMPNHFHILIEQTGEIPVSKFMHKICTSYSMYMNKKYHRVGHIFQDRFKSVLVETDAQLKWTSAYIHTNPIKDGLAKNPKEYRWSSYQDFVMGRHNPLLTTDFLLSVFENRDNFAKQNVTIPKSTMITNL